MRIGNLTLGLLVTILGIAAVWQATGFATRPGLVFGPGLFPALLGVGLVGAGVLTCFMARFERTAPITGDAVPQEKLTLKGVLGILAIVAGILFYVIASPLAGFMPTMFVLVTAMCLLFGATWLAALITGASTAVLLFFTFAFLLRVPLPYGPLELLVT